MTNSGQLLLLLDTSTPSLHAGLLGRDGWLALEVGEGDALEKIFQLVEAALGSAGVTLNDCQGFIHCEGPGSLLGLRLAAMAIATWRQLPALKDAPLWAYSCTSAAEQLVRSQTPEPEPYHILLPFRRNLFYTRDHTGAETLLEATELHNLSGTTYFIPQRNFAEPPTGARVLDYNLRPLGQIMLSDITASQPTFLAPRSQPRVFTPKPQEYKRWTGQRHTAADRS